MTLKNAQCILKIGNMPRKKFGKERIKKNNFVKKKIFLHFAVKYTVVYYFLEGIKTPPTQAPPPPF